MLREGGERFRIYYLPETSLWLRLEIEENRVESYVVGILLSKLPLSSERRSPRHEITEVTIRGVKLGDLPSKLENLFGKPLREYKADLGPNKDLTVMEFFPPTLELGSCIRLYLKDGNIAAFSFSGQE